MYTDRSRLKFKQNVESVKRINVIQRKSGIFVTEDGTPVHSRALAYRKREFLLVDATWSDVRP